MQKSICLTQLAVSPFQTKKIIIIKKTCLCEWMGLSLLERGGYKEKKNLTNEYVKEKKKKERNHWAK